MNKLSSGIIYALASSLTFSVMNVLVKLTASSIPSNEIVFFRSVIGMLLISVIIKQRGIKLSTENRKILLLRGSLGGAYMVVYFMALSKLPLIDTMVLVNLSPIFVFIFSYVFLKELLPKGMLTIIPIVLIGVLLTLSPWSFDSFGSAALWGIAAAVFSGASATTIRYLGKNGHHPLEIIFYFMMMSTLISIPLMWSSFVMPTGWQWLALIMIGVVSLLAQVYLTKAFSHENALLVEIVRYVGVVFNALWGLAIWKEIPTFTTVIGGCLIICGCIALSRQKKKEQERLELDFKRG